MNCQISSYAPRFLAFAVVAVLAVTISGAPAHAQILCTTTMTGCPFSFVGGTLDNLGQNVIDPAGWTPLTPGGVLELTSNTPNQRGAAWSSTQQQVAGGFGVEFQFRVTTAVGVVGDGLAFVIQNSSGSAIGGFGGGIGYGTREFDPCSGLATAAQYSVSPCAAGSDLGIPKSVAIEFDTFQNNGYDLDADHVAIQSCGVANNLPDHTSPCLIARSGSLQSLPYPNNPINLAVGTHYAQIVYLPYTATCPTANPCPNLSVYIDPAINPAPVVQAHVDLNNPCTAAGCPAGTILNSGKAWVGFTAATRGAQSEHDILSFTYTPAITLPLQGSGATNSFVFPFATYNVTYPADVPVSNTTMTITPTLLPQADCNPRVNVFGEGNNPTCTTFPAAGGDAVIFDVACAMGTNQSQGELCPTTSGFNPSQPTATFHSGEDILNIVTFPGTIPAGIAPQFLTASEGTNDWVPIGVGFSADITKGGGTNNYQSQMVLADFPLTGGTSPFAIPPYQFIGFNPPVTNQGNNVMNVAKAGQTIPLKWQLNYPTCPANQNCMGFNGGPVTNSALDPAGFVTILAAQGCSFAPGTTPSTETIPVDTETKTGLINDGNGSYHFNWMTLKSFAGQCLTATVNVGDGVPHNADFQFK
jgi:hypothetical protein